MGNTPSNGKSNDGNDSKLPIHPRSASTRSQRTSPSPTPGHPHHSLRHKKRSLELPDIQLDFTPNQPIPIPSNPNRPERPRNRRQQSGTSTYSQQPSITSFAQPLTPPNSENTPVPAFVPTPLEEEPEPYKQEVVRSTLPLPLAFAEVSPDPSNDLVETPVVWNGDGTNVFVARAGDDDWSSLIPMHRDGDRFIARVQLPPGTHHLRFVVDEQSRVADDMPKAVDDQGAFANYVSVGLSSPPPTASTMMQARNQSFWSTSSVGGDGHTRKLMEPGWTNVIPLELTEAAAEEDAFIANYNANATTHSGRQVVTGFDVLPALPPAPVLPRHLEKQILNVANSSSSSSSERRRGRHRHDHGGHSHSRTHLPEQQQQPSVLPVTTASGTDLSSFAAGIAGMSMTPTVANPAATQDDVAVIADDNSVLPVPSHVVLNHLSTSSTRNGVLAVAETVRYRNKFLTTIYYKPT